MQEATQSCRIIVKPTLINGLCDAVKDLLREVERLYERSQELQAANKRMELRLIALESKGLKEEAALVGAEALVKAHANVEDFRLKERLSR